MSTIEVNQERLDVLDSLRGFAAVIVAFLTHYPVINFITDDTMQPYGKNQLLIYLKNNGTLCVYFFFVLSGFVFQHVYADKIGSKKVTFNQYVINRFARLYPVHFLTLQILLIDTIYVRIRHGEIYAPIDIFSFLKQVPLLGHGWVEVAPLTWNQPMWSVSCEIFAYIVFFATLYVIGQKYQVRTFCAIILIATAIVTSGLDFPIINHDMAICLVGFFMGCLTYKIWTIAKKIPVLSKITIAISIPIVILLPIVHFIYGDAYFGNKTGLCYIFTVFPAIILVSLLLKPVQAVLSLKPFIILGDISFTIYCLHYPVYTVFRMSGALEIFDTLSLFFYFTTIVTIIILSLIVYFLFELPIKRLIRSWYFAHKQ